MSVPTPDQVLAAMLDHGADVTTYKGWNKTGGAVPTRGVLLHHTASSSASPSNPAPTLGWCVSAYNKPVANMLVGKTPGHTYLFAALTGNGDAGAYHCGNGGPIPWADIPVGNRPDLLWGIEIDDPGVKVGTLTDYQIDNTVKVVAGLWDVFGWTDERAIMTHKCWTDGCHGENPDGPSPYVGRKNDTIDGAWGAWPGNPNPEPYNAPYWRELVDGELGRVSYWDGTIPSRSAAMKVHPEKGENPGGRNKAAWRLRARLVDLGYASADNIDDKPPSTYPKSAMKKFREAQGWDGDGLSEKAQKRIFGEVKP